MALLPKPFVIPSDNTSASISYKPKRVREWHSMDRAHATGLFMRHVLCLFAPSTFSWSAFWLALALYVIIGMFGITLSYHRNLSHRSFKLPKYLEYLFAYIGVHAIQGDPIFWVSTHRHHHKFTDKDQDPHSPIEGFWFSHINWLFDYKYMCSKGDYYNNVEDLKSQRFYRFLHKSYYLHLGLLPILLYKFGGFSFVVWGVGVRAVLLSHATFMINSVCHTWGHQAWNTGDLSKNNWMVALLMFGEGWHNNHHAFEFSARHGFECWQIDPTWYMIKLLESVGLATNVRLPSETHKQKKSFKNGMNNMKMLPSKVE